MANILTEDICPSMTSDILNKLNAIKVNSVLDLLLSDLPKLRSISRSKAIDFQTLSDIKNELYLRFGAKKVNAFSMFTKNILNSNPISFNTGIERLDQMLKNGIRSGELTEVYGSSDSGKTQFCYTFMLNAVKSTDKGVLYLDTNLSFSDSRVEEILCNRFEVLSDQEIEDILSKIKVIDVFDMNSVLNAFESISYELETNPNSDLHEIGLVIVDSVSTPLTLEMKRNYWLASEVEKCIDKQKANNNKFQTIEMITQMANTLHSFASKHSMSVVVVNSQSVGLKQNWKNYCNLCLEFVDQSSDGSKSSLRTIKISQSYDKSIENLSFNGFEICSKGMISQ